MSNSVFNAYSRYYDLLYSDKDYVGEAAYIQNLLVHNGISQGALLEFGSGTGKHGCLLAANGFIVHGIERSAAMVADSHKASGFSCEQGDIGTAKMGTTYDAVLSLFHVISYQTTNAQLQGVFANAAEHLTVGGLFVFDFWYSPAVFAQKPSVRMKRMANDDVEITRFAEPKLYPNENRVDVLYTIFARDVASDAVKTFQEIHPMRHFSLPEIDLLAGVHGFERIQTEEFFTGNEPSENTWGVCALLRKIL